MGKVRDTLLEQFGGEEGLSLEMKRRRALRKDYSTSGFAHYKRTNQPEKILEAAQKSAEARRKKKQS